MPSPTAPTSAARQLLRLRRCARRRLLAHRRALAAALAAVAVLAGLRAADPPPDPTLAMLVAARDLPPGERLDAADVEVVRVAPEHRPPRSVGRAIALGRTLAAPLGRGEAVTDLRLVSDRLLDTTPGLVAVPVRLPDAGVVDLLAVGDVVDVVATAPRGGAAATVALGAVVLALPTAPATGAAAGAAAATGAAPPGGLVVLGVPPEVAGPLSAAAVRDYLGVVWTG